MKNIQWIVPLIVSVALLVVWQWLCVWIDPTSGSFTIGAAGRYFVGTIGFMLLVCSVFFILQHQFPTIDKALDREEFKDWFDCEPDQKKLRITLCVLFVLALLWLACVWLAPTV